MFHFYTSWKRQKNFWFSESFEGCVEIKNLHEMHEGLWSDLFFCFFDTEDEVVTERLFKC